MAGGHEGRGDADRQHDCSPSLTSWAPEWCLGGPVCGEGRGAGGGGCLRGTWSCGGGEETGPRSGCLGV